MIFLFPRVGYVSVPWRVSVIKVWHSMNLWPRKEIRQSLNSAPRRKSSDADNLDKPHKVRVVSETTTYRACVVPKRGGAFGKTKNSSIRAVRRGFGTSTIPFFLVRKNRSTHLWIIGFFRRCVSGDGSNHLKWFCSEAPTFPSATRRSGSWHEILLWDGTGTCVPGRWGNPLD